MFYRIVEEKCEQGIKSRYSKNQKIDDAELFNLTNEFKHLLVFWGSGCQHL